MIEPSTTRIYLRSTSSLLLTEQWQKSTAGRKQERFFIEFSGFDWCLMKVGSYVCNNRPPDPLICDIAHVIRSQRTRQFNAVRNLEAMHHWCLTGTPISNKVEDLGALVSICRVPLLQERAVFREHVVKPTRRSFRAGCGAVQRTLAPLCLRRTKDLLDLPQPVFKNYIVCFSSSENEHYRNVMKQCRKSLDAAVSGRHGLKHSMLQAILQLRIFCNQGTYSTFARPCAEDGLDPDEALALLQQNDLARCSNCSREVLILNQLEDSESGVLATCTHVLCRLCYDSAVDATDAAAFVCPACEQTVCNTRLQPWHDAGEATSRDERHSSKIDKLLEDLAETKAEHKKYLPAKSLNMITNLTS